MSPNTRSAYRAGWRRFADYCDATGNNPMAATPDDVAGFLVRMASRPRSPNATTRKGEPLAMGTIRVVLAAINRKYREKNRRSPASDVRVSDVLRGLARRTDHGPRQVKALRAGQIALDKIMEVTRHTSARMVLRYIRQAEAFEDHAGAAFL